MSSPDSKPSLPARLAGRYADLIVRRPLTVVLTLAVLALGSGWASSRLTINSNQLDLISQDLRQVKDVKRVVDMVGGAGFLMIGIRGEDEAVLKKVSDDLAVMLKGDKENVRTVTHKVPVEFMQKNVALFVEPADLREAKGRINVYVKEKIREANPFGSLGLTQREPPKLEMNDIVSKYSSVGKKSIVDDYYISNDRKMILMLVKPMWQTTELDKTEAYLEKIRADFAAYSKANAHGISFDESYEQKPGTAKSYTFGFTGSYKTTLDDSAAIRDSLEPTTVFSFIGIVAILLLYFRKPFAVMLVGGGMALGALFTMGFTYVTIGELNMITSIIAAILMGLGEDFGVHLVSRMRLEFGEGKSYEQAIHDALEQNAVPAFISAIATSGAFYALMFSEFRGFSQFGFLAGFGILITGLVLLSLKPAILVLIGRWKPHLPAKLIGVTKPVEKNDAEGIERRIPNPKAIIAVCTAVLVGLAAFALPLRYSEANPMPKDADFWQRLGAGVRFDYNTRSLLPDDQTSVKMQDEIDARFDISSDPTAVYTRTLAEAKTLWETMRTPGSTKHTDVDRARFSTVDQVVSLYTFVPPVYAAENAKILEEWQEELVDIDPASLPPDLQDRATMFKEMLAVRPFGVEGIPDVYKKQFMHLPTTQVENHGYLTFIYPQVDLWDGKNMLAFAEQTETITTADGTEYHSAGLPILYAKLAKIVLFDAKLAVGLTALWILVVLLLDFRSIKYTLAALLPLGLGMLVMLGVMALLDRNLNFMNIVVLPVVLGYGVSHGVYLLHRFLEGTSPVVALRSVGQAVFFSTMTTIAGFAALMAASHHGLKSMGVLACIGLFTTLLVSFTLLAAVLQVLHDRRERSAGQGSGPDSSSKPGNTAGSADIKAA